MAASTPAARVVVTAAAGAPAVPAGFLNAGLLVAGGGGVSAGLVAGVIGGGAALGGVVVAAGDGKDERPPGRQATVPPTLPPTVAGLWSGVGADGMQRDMVDNQNAPTCHRSDEVFLELQEAGGMVTGNARYVSRAGTTCNLEPFGTVRAFAVTGTRSGTAVRPEAVPDAAGRTQHPRPGRHARGIAAERDGDELVPRRRRARRLGGAPALTSGAVQPRGLPDQVGRPPVVEGAHPVGRPLLAGQREQAERVHVGIQDGHHAEVRAPFRPGFQ